MGSGRLMCFARMAQQPLIDKDVWLRNGHQEETRPAHSRQGRPGHAHHRPSRETNNASKRTRRRLSVRWARLSTYPANDASGARLYGGRWNQPGVSAPYPPPSIAVAMLEILVHYATSLTGFSLTEVKTPGTSCRKSRVRSLFRALSSGPTMNAARRGHDAPGRWGPCHVDGKRYNMQNVRAKGHFEPSNWRGALAPPTA